MVDILTLPHIGWCHTRTTFMRFLVYTSWSQEVRTIGHNPPPNGTSSPMLLLTWILFFHHYGSYLVLSRFPFGSWISQLYAFWMESSSVTGKCSWVPAIRVPVIRCQNLDFQDTLVHRCPIPWVWKVQSGKRMTTFFRSGNFLRSLLPILYAPAKPRYDLVNTLYGNFFDTEESAGFITSSYWVTLWAFLPLMHSSSLPSLPTVVINKTCQRFGHGCSPRVSKVSSSLFKFVSSPQDPFLQIWKCPVCQDLIFTWIGNWTLCLTISSLGWNFVVVVAVIVAWSFSLEVYQECCCSGIHSSFSHRLACSLHFWSCFLSGFETSQYSAICSGTFLSTMSWQYKLSSIFFHILRLLNGWSVQTAALSPSDFPSHSFGDAMLAISFSLFQRLDFTWLECHLALVSLSFLWISTPTYKRRIWLPPKIRWAYHGPASTQISNLKEKSATRQWSHQSGMEYCQATRDSSRRTCQWTGCTASLQ